MPFPKFRNNLPVFFLSFLAFYLIFGLSIKEKKVSFKYSAQVSFEQDGFKYFRTLKGPFELLSRDIERRLENDTIFLEREARENKGREKEFQAEVEAFAASLEAKIKQARLHEKSVLEEQIKAVSVGLQGLKADLSRLSKAKEERDARLERINKEQQAITQKLNSLELEKEKLLLVYTPNHPDVISLENQIAFIKGKSQKVPQVQDSGFDLQDELSEKTALYEQKKEELSQLEKEKAADKLAESGAMVSLKESPAVASGQSSMPKKAKVLLLSFAFSLLAFLLFFFLDSRVYSGDEIRDFEVISDLPKIKQRLFKSFPFYPGHADAEISLKKITISLKDKKIIFISSPHKFDGKTSVAFNLGLFLARQAKKVLLVDFDLSHPSLQRLLRVKEDARLYDFLKDAGDSAKRAFNFSDIILEQPEIEGLIKKSGLDRVSVLFCRKEAKIDLGHYKKLISGLAESYDYVICDCPQLSDPLAEMIGRDEMILVARSGRTRKKELKKAFEILSLAKIEKKNIILNLCT